MKNIGYVLILKISSIFFACSPMLNVMEIRQRCTHGIIKEIPKKPVIAVVSKVITPNTDKMKLIAQVATAAPTVLKKYPRLITKALTIIKRGEEMASQANGMGDIAAMLAEEFKLDQEVQQVIIKAGIAPVADQELVKFIKILKDEGYYIIFAGEWQDPEHHKVYRKALEENCNINIRELCNGGIITTRSALNDQEDIYEVNNQGYENTWFISRDKLPKERYLRTLRDLADQSSPGAPIYLIERADQEEREVKHLGIKILPYQSVEKLRKLIKSETSSTLETT